eukprot:225830_1
MAEGCPIESNIKNTAGQNDEYNAMKIADDDFGDSNDAEFDDEDGDALGGADDGWGSIHSSDEEAQYKPKHEVDVVVIGANEENPFAEGNDAVQVVEAGGRPMLNDKGDPKQKCWICDVCHGINNLLESMQKYNYKCCLCSYAYHPQVAIIYSNDWDGINAQDNEEIYTVWSCCICTFKNLMDWSKCEGCQTQRPRQDQVIISYSYVKPLKLDGNVPNNQNQMNFNIPQQYGNNQNHAKPKKKPKPFVRKPRIGNIGIPRNITEYPASSVQNDGLEKRLVNVFGKPFRNKRLVNATNKWCVDGQVLHSRVEWTSMSHEASQTKYVKEELVGRGFAVNSRTGWIASMSSDHIWVFEPSASTQYRLIATYSFNDQQKLTGQDVANSRIRSVQEN